MRQTALKKAVWCRWHGALAVALAPDTSYKYCTHGLFQRAYVRYSLQP